MGRLLHTEPGFFSPRISTSSCCHDSLLESWILFLRFYQRGTDSAKVGPLLCVTCPVCWLRGRSLNSAGTLRPWLQPGQKEAARVGHFYQLVEMIIEIWKPTPRVAPTWFMNRLGSKAVSTREGFPEGSVFPSVRLLFRFGYEWFVHQLLWSKPDSLGRCVLRFLDLQRSGIYFQGLSGFTYLWSRTLFSWLFRAHFLRC